MSNWAELEKEARELLALDEKRVTKGEWDNIDPINTHLVTAGCDEEGCYIYADSDEDARFQAAAPRMAALIRRFLEEGCQESAPNDGWIAWSGGKCPVTPTTEIEVHFRDDTYQFGVGNEYFWSQYGEPDDIIAYRIVEGQP